MSPDDAAGQLEGIASSDDFVARSSELVDAWSSAGAGVEIVDTVLSFVERHPNVDVGSPGPLVHLAERFYGNGYERKLLDSIERKPMPLTAWMLNRIINGTKTLSDRSDLIEAMRRIIVHPLADDATRQMAGRFVERATN
ncbi:MAG TPA: hypothetical protein VG426_15220 [Candidatus Dormibacteraeota bacterium]|jgi:hypothetical protein|nr:hypothetical protein [Candidatus Dormibacteraeota bacterium]